MMDYTIDKNAVLSYLGYCGSMPDDAAYKEIDNIISLAYEYIDPKSVYGIFRVSSKDGIVYFENLFEVRSKDLYNLLKYSRHSVLAAYTLGSRIEQYIKRLSYTSLNKALILDCCAAAAIESYADNIISNISDELKCKNQSVTNRFSCGYGDFSLSHQADILYTLSCEKKIGLYADANNTLYPKKSMTAVMGITDFDINHKYYASCETCAAKNSCRYRKAGLTCAS